MAPADDGPDGDRAALRRFCEDLAVEAGTGALAGRRSLGVGRPAYDTKSSPTDPVTEYDRAAETLIVAAVRARFPDDSIVGEEGTDHAGSSSRAWHIDPIDGTANFVYDLPGWCTSIAVVDETGPLAGAVYVPVGRRALLRRSRSGSGPERPPDPLLVGDRPRERPDRHRVQLHPRTPAAPGRACSPDSWRTCEMSVAPDRQPWTCVRSPAPVSTPTTRST